MSSRWMLLGYCPMGLFWDLGSDILVIGAVILYGINSIANTLMQSKYPHYDLFAPKRVIPGFF